jgi:hypothetical protein
LRIFARTVFLVYEKAITVILSFRYFFIPLFCRSACSCRSDTLGRFRRSVQNPYPLRRNIDKSQLIY